MKQEEKKENPTNVGRKLANARRKPTNAGNETHWNTIR